MLDSILARVLQTALLVAALLVPSTTWAQPVCWPAPIDSAGKGAARGVTEGVEWSAWWCEHNFLWKRMYWFRLPGFQPVLPPIGTMTTAKEYAIAIWQANQTTKSCYTNTPAEAVAACNAMVGASNLTQPPPILYNVGPATATNGTRPGYRFSAGTLTLDGLRHLAGTACECYRGAQKAGATQYCLVTKTESYAVCVRQP